MRFDRLLVIFLGIAVCIEFYSCTSAINKQMDFAEANFIKEVSIITEKEALSKEIDYYKAPEITLKQHSRSLTGKDLIHECNIIIRNEQERLKNRRILPMRTQSVERIKEYALGHPDDIIANEFKFRGIFTHYGENKYGERSATIIVVPELKRYIRID